MKALRVRIEKGQITGRAPAGFPEGDVDLCLADADDAMTDDELSRLNTALEAGWRCIEEGRLRPAAAVIEALRQR